MLRLSVFVCLAATAASLTTLRPLSRSSLSRGHHRSAATRLAPLHSLATGWEAQVDPASGQTYYMNSQTGESQWEPPQGTTGTATAQWYIDGVAGVAGFSGVEGYTDRRTAKFIRFVAANKFAGSLHTEKSDDAHQLEHEREGRPCQLPYGLGVGQVKVLSRFNMVTPKDTVGKGQCTITCAPDGAAILASAGDSPTLVRAPGGQWEAIYQDQQHYLSEGDQISLDCDDPEGAVFVCNSDAGGQQQQQQQQQQGGQAAGGAWEAQVDPASGQTYYMNSQTGESQWEVPQ